MNSNKNCQWRIARRPSGNVVHEDFEYHENEIPKIENGQILLKTLYLNLAPVMRMYMSGKSIAGEAALYIGDVIHGRGVGELVTGKLHTVTRVAGKANDDGLLLTVLVTLVEFLGLLTVTHAGHAGR